ncbi:MAG: hypothetical protein ACKVOB_07920 [Sphingomonas sp.]
MISKWPCHILQLRRLGRIGSARLAFLALAATAITPGHAASVRAGTVISNTATATFSDGASTQSVTSNTVTVLVDEVLDVTVTARETADVAVPAGATARPLGFTVTNTGNGDEAFRLDTLATVSGNNFDPAITGYAIDSNNNGVYDPGVDTALALGGSTPTLAPDASVTVFVLSNVPGTATDQQRGRLRFTASAATGTGTPGQVFAGQGTGGGDAVVGATTATANATSGFVVSRTSLVLTKSAAILDPFGGSRAIPGAVITWTISAAASGTGAVSNLRITDNIPVGTTYQPSTLTLDGAPLSDVADSDAGTASGAGIDVLIATQTTGTTRQVQFKTRIN